MALQVHNKSSETNDILDAITYSEFTQYDSVQCYFLTNPPSIFNWYDAYHTNPDNSFIFLHIKLIQKKWNATDLATIHTGYITAHKERIIKINKEKLVLLKPILANAQQLSLIVVTKQL